MAHDNALRAQAERLYVDEFQGLGEISKALGVPAPTLYRWAKESDWAASREAVCGMQDRLGRLINAQMTAVSAEADVDPQRLHGLANLMDKYEKLKKVRERLVYTDDAELLIGTMREMSQFAPLLEDQAVMAELGERLKEKVKKM